MSHTSSPPSIRVYDSGSRHGRYSSIPRRIPSHTSTPAAPMPIPHARESPPPPLPPPRYISGLDTGTGSGTHDLPSWQVGSPRHDGGFGSGFGSIRSGLSLLSSMHAQKEALGEDVDMLDSASSRRHSSSTTIHTVDTDMNGDGFDSDEERSVYSRRPSVVSRRLHSESQLGQRSLENSSQAYDKQLLAKMGGPNSGSLGSRSGGGGPFLSPTSQEPQSQPRSRSPRGQLKPLAMPDRRYNNTIESPLTRWTSAPSSGVSPGTTTFRSPFETSHPESFSRRHNSTSTSDTYDDSRSKRGSDDQGVFMDHMDHDFGVEENGMRDLNLNERSPGGSDDFQLGSGPPMKRRAPSPPSEALREDRAAAGNDLYHRRSTQLLNSRASPVSRYNAAHGSVSSASSFGGKTGSYASTMSWNQSVASSITSYGERLSPSAMSPSVETDYGPMSPYAASRSLNPSPRSSVSKAPHQRTFSESEPSQSRKMSADSTSHSRQSSISNQKIQGLYICECCPKKPKKFDSAQELRAHEQEKQYQCQYCPNRFKNKNEAERHQNSLHLRRHSWSCAALAGVQAAFHPSAQQAPAASDICGYCGKEYPNPPNWDERSDHLNHVHKFGECNQAKKFFRADHFRQHLKHSHAGASGKWTNQLENACMKDEPPPTVPPPPGQKERMGSLGGLSSALGSPIGLNSNPSSAIPGVIDEVHEES